MQEILQFDESLFRLINGSWQHPWLDVILRFWRDKYHWIPLYLLLAVFSIYRFHWKGLFLVLGMAAVVGLSDTLSHRVIKEQVQRLRPCRTEGLAEEVHLLVSCGGGYSFTSNHAANHFALAFFITGTLGRIYRRIRWPFWIWAGLVAYAQIYVGVHFPLDVLFGGLLGALIGLVGAFIFEQKIGLSPKI